MAVILDSSLLIAIERERIGLDEIERRCGSAGMALSAVTVAELLHGVHSLRSSKGKTQASVFVEGLIEGMPVLPFDLLCARVHAEVHSVLRRRGVTIGAHDLLIGATALANGFGVATSDARSFPRIPGLEVEVFEVQG